jgi:pSer/pThr/pTyr-binding forkhead associated (FHA) protein
MHSKIVLTAERGFEGAQRFVFDAPTCCVLGRAADCDLHVPNDAAHKTVSRHHCMLGVNPPYIWIRDLGSRNGTYVNATAISHRTNGEAHPGEVVPEGAFALEDGDAILAGNVLLTVHVLEGRNSSVNWECPGVRLRVKGPS